MGEFIGLVFVGSFVWQAVTQLMAQPIQVSEQVSKMG